jgi:hypothetical protein
MPGASAPMGLRPSAERPSAAPNCALVETGVLDLTETFDAIATWIDRRLSA